MVNPYASRKIQYVKARDRGDPRYDPASGDAPGDNRECADCARRCQREGRLALAQVASELRYGPASARDTQPDMAHAAVGSGADGPIKEDDVRGRPVLTETSTKPSCNSRIHAPPWRHRDNGHKWRVAARRERPQDGLPNSNSSDRDTTHPQSARAWGARGKDRCLESDFARRVRGSQRTRAFMVCGGVRGSPMRNTSEQRTNSP